MGILIVIKCVSDSFVLEFFSFSWVKERKKRSVTGERVGRNKRGGVKGEKCNNDISI